MRLVRRGPVPVTGCPGCETAGEPITATRWLLQTWLWVPRRDVGDAALLLLVLDARQRWRIDRAAGGSLLHPHAVRGGDPQRRVLRPASLSGRSQPLWWGERVEEQGRTRSAKG